MGRIMAIDYGIKRTGLAVTDELQLIATALTTVETPKLMPFIDDYLKKEPVECFVVGEAKHLNNTPSESAQYIEPFVEKLRNKYPQIPIERIDERFTSKIAFQAMIDGGLSRKQRQNKALIDSVSAVLILQNYMQSRDFAKSRTNTSNN
ncbi:MAG: Holliday junction resolvase RuvX [Bacteroidales bacterium]|nr:Holliday junction resolvase RuvX [Bacteroidales bacterium]